MISVMPDARIEVHPLPNYLPELEKFTFPSLRGFLRLVGTSACDPGSGGVPFAYVARIKERIAGMVLCGHSQNAPIEARIHSIYVAPNWRCQGIATRLWREAEVHSLKAGAARISVNYVVGKPSIAAIERILVLQGWSEPSMSMLVIKMHVDLAVKAPWYREWSLPDSYALVDWDMLSEDQLQELDSHRKPDSWIPSDLDPELFLKDHHRETSLALLKDGKVRGWLINHIVEGVLRYSCSFVHPELQRKGRVFCLYSEAVRRMPSLGLTEGIWTVPTRHPAMQSFAIRWMKPYSSHFTESRGSFKCLGSSSMERSSEF
jgi:GNAT superfamily N-acetyltransferase